MGNIMLGSDGISIRQGIYEESKNSKTDLGRFVDFQDGRRFRYCQADGEIIKGHMCSASAVDANMNTVTQAGMAVTISNGYVGEKVIKVLLGAATTLNLFEEGYFVVEGGVGLGQFHVIRKNKAGGSSVAVPCELTLYDPLLVALDATSVISITKNKYKDVIVTPSSETATPIGVPLITVTDNYFFWAQTRGYCCIIVGSSGTLTVGQLVAIDNSVSGGLDPVGGYTEKPFGVAVQVAEVDAYATIDLQLE